jgi:pilus biogenesis lipoprotein CpaD
VAAGLVLALAGCHSAGQEDYQDRYRIEAQMKTFRAEVPMPRVLPDGTGAEIAMVPGFLEDYERRARSSMRVQVPRDPSARDLQSARMLLDWLSDRGVETTVVPSDISDLPPADGYVGLSYDAYVAVVPNCGDWSGQTGFNPSNLPHTNYGCAYQRNIGLMLSDPGDLERSRPAGAVDTARQRLVVEKYRAGAATGAAVPGSEAGSLTGLGGN